MYKQNREAADSCKKLTFNIQSQMEVGKLHEESADLIYKLAKQDKAFIYTLNVQTYKTIITNMQFLSTP